jgi:hypothetical protein
MSHYSYAEEHGAGHHANHRSTVNRSLTVHRELTVAEAVPQLAGHVGEWITRPLLGRKDEIKICNRVTMIAGEAYVHVERKYPWTGGVIPAKSIVIPEPMAIMLRPPMAIVVWKEKDSLLGA